jgi:hypothetical protein
MREKVRAGGRQWVRGQKELLENGAMGFSTEE